jgi:hypothetical protein
MRFCSEPVFIVEYKNTGKEKMVMMMIKTKKEEERDPSKD